MTQFRSKTLVALGGNLPSGAGPTVRTLVSAIAAMPGEGMSVRAVSRFYHTPCFPAGAGPDFVNAVAAVDTVLAPQEVLAALHRIEALNGRVRNDRWSARTLDLDLLAVGDLVLPDVTGFRSWLDLPPDRQADAAPNRLILPHPRLQDRAFVLVPLADIAPDWRHPVLGLTARDLCDRLPSGVVGQVTAL